MATDKNTEDCCHCGGSWDVLLPITQRGNFFQDSFFSDAHQDFQAAVRKVLGHWDDDSQKRKETRDETIRKFKANWDDEQHWDDEISKLRSSWDEEDLKFMENWDSKVHKFRQDWGNEDFKHSGNWSDEIRKSFMDSWGDDSKVNEMKTFQGDEDKQLASKQVNTASNDDFLERYRNLRSRHMKEDSQAVTVTSDNSCHKIVLDMSDFNGGDVEVKVVGERELVVEGKSSAPFSTFRRHFTLPQETDMTAITSVMSSDGILTVTANKKVEVAETQPRVIQVQRDANHDASGGTSSSKPTLNTNHDASGSTSSSKPTLNVSLDGSIGTSSSKPALNVNHDVSGDMPSSKPTREDDRQRRPANGGAKKCDSNCYKCFLKDVYKTKAVVNGC